GYSWYDALPRVTDIVFTIDMGDKSLRYGDDDILPADILSDRVDAITLDVTVVNLPDDPDGSERHSFPVEALVCRNDGYGSLDEAVIFVGRNAAIELGALAW